MVRERWLRYSVEETDGKDSETKAERMGGMLCTETKSLMITAAVSLKRTTDRD